MVGATYSSKLSAGNSYTFDFGGIRYWLKHDWLSMVSYHVAVDNCARDYDADLATARSADAYSEFQKQIEYRIPLGWSEIRIWTRDQNVSPLYGDGCCI